MTSRRPREWGSRPGSYLIFLSLRLVQSAPFVPAQTRFCAGGVGRGDCRCREQARGLAHRRQNGDLLAEFYAPRGASGNWEASDRGLCSYRWLVATAGACCARHDLRKCDIGKQRRQRRRRSIGMPRKNPRRDHPNRQLQPRTVNDNSDLTTRTCVLDLGRADQWPFRGACQSGEQSRLTGPYLKKKIGNIYYMQTWDKVETP